jgi:hypothetical protein
MAYLSAFVFEAIRMKLITTFILLIIAIAVLAQEYEYVPLPTDNAVWSTDLFSSVDCGEWPGLCSQGQYVPNGDTLINNISYTMLSPRFTMV